MTSKTIHTRGLTSLFTLFGFVIMSITGLVLYVEPAGRVAYWITWKMGGLSKDDWGNIHILSSLLFIVAGVFHTVLNWRPLMNHLKDKARRGFKLRREFAISSIVSAWIVIGAIWPSPPLSYLLDFNSWLKESWVVEDAYEPPFGHAELLSLNSFTKRMEIPLTDATQELKDNGIEFGGVDETLEEIALYNGMAPMELYLLIKKFEPAPEPAKLAAYTPESIEVKFAGTGIGNRSIASVCEKLGLDTTTAVSRLAAAQMVTQLDQTLKNVAQTAATEPIEIMKVLLLENYRPQ